MPPANVPFVSRSRIERIPNGERMCAAICRPRLRPIVQDCCVLGSPS